MRHLIWITVLALGIIGGKAEASLTTLKQVQVSGGSQIDLLFDGKVAKNQIKTEFFNDIVQISLNDVNVYPAKISSINGGSLVKVFAYQYAPKLVRCRITVRGKAEDFKDAVRVSPSGKMLTVRFDDAAASAGTGHDTIALRSSAPVRAAAPAAAAPKSVETVQVSDAEEKALLERVLAAQKPVAVKETPSVAQEKGAAEKTRETAAASERSEKADSRDSEKGEKGEKGRTQQASLKGIGSARPVPGFAGVFAKLGAVLALFLVVAFVMKKLLGGKNAQGLDLGKGGGLMANLGRFAKGGLGRKHQMIEVLSTHYLGPKKSIAVVRVLGRTLVLGVSNDAINLITQLPAGGSLEEGLGDASGLPLEELGIRVNSEPTLGGPAPAGRPMGSGAVSAGQPSFADLLGMENTKPSFGANGGLGAHAGPRVTSPVSKQPGVRAQIRSRLEGLKPL